MEHFQSKCLEDKTVTGYQSPTYVAQYVDCCSGTQIKILGKLRLYF